MENVFRGELRILDDHQPEPSWNACLTTQAFDLTIPRHGSIFITKQRWLCCSPLDVDGWRRIEVDTSEDRLAGELL